MSQYEREIDDYWSQEAARAYEERRQSVRDALRQTGGQPLGWMRFTVTPADFKREYEAYWFPAPLPDSSKEG